MAVDFSKRMYDVKMAILEIFGENLQQVRDQTGIYEGMNLETWTGASRAIVHLHEQIFGELINEGDFSNDP